MTQFPKAFDGVRCLVGSQPVTMKTIVQRRLALLGVPDDRIDELEQRITLRTSIGFARRAPQERARNDRRHAPRLLPAAGSGIIAAGFRYRLLTAPKPLAAASVDVTVYAFDPPRARRFTQ
jgi:hypothetical protein